MDFADGNYEEYVYNALGERVQIKRNGQLIQRLLYDELMVPVALVDSSGAGEYLTQGTGAGGIGGLIANGSEYYHYNHRGDVVNAGSASYTYDAFGHVMSADTPAFGHSTKPLDPATGFSWFGYRSYTPDLGRWLTRDPIGFSGGMNFYGYVGNNPVNEVDLLGLYTPERLLNFPMGPGPNNDEITSEYLNAVSCNIETTHHFFANPWTLNYMGVPPGATVVTARSVAFHTGGRTMLEWVRSVTYPTGGRAILEWIRSGAIFVGFEGALVSWYANYLLFQTFYPVGVILGSFISAIPLENNERIGNYFGNRLYPLYPHFRSPSPIIPLPRTPNDAMNDSRCLYH